MINTFRVNKDKYRRNSPRSTLRVHRARTGKEWYRGNRARSGLTGQVPAARRELSNPEGRAFPMMVGGRSGAGGRVHRPVAWPGPGRRQRVARVVTGTW